MYGKSIRSFCMVAVLALILQAQYGQSYIYTGYEVIDLNATGSAFEKDTLAWSATRLYAGTMLSYNCAGTVILGGYQIIGQPNQGQYNDYFQRVYSNLPVHNTIRYTMTVYAVDSWDAGSNDGFYLSFDSTAVDGLHIPFAYHPIQLCGVTWANDWKELPNIRVMGSVAHSSSSLVFRFRPYFDEDSNNESVGFRDVNIAFLQSPNITSAPTLCGSVSSPINKGACTCPEGQYPTTANNAATCTKCHTSCSSCFGPTEAHCYSCKKPGFGWDGSKCVACAPGCFTCNGATPGVCKPCPVGQIYYPETDSCSDYCDYPLNLVTSQYGLTCSNPCPGGQYLNMDQTCTLSCPAPSQIVTTNNYFKLCVN